MYLYTLIVTLDDPTKALADSSYSVHTNPFTVTVIDACDITVLDPILVDPAVTQLNYNLPDWTEGSNELTFAEPEDSSSKTQGLKDGYTFCGDRYMNLYLVNADATTTLLDLSGANNVSF